jgi:hypothetical protein
MSWKPEVIADNSGKWVDNALRFETKEESDDYVRDLSWRWSSVRETRSVECDEPANYLWANGKSEPIVPEVIKRKPVGYTEAEIERSQARLVALFGEEELSK